MTDEFENELRELLSCASLESEQAAEILKLADSKSKLYEISPAAISDKLGDSTASFITLCAALASRRDTNKFKMKKKHTEQEIEEFFLATFRGVFAESIYQLSFDSEGRALACDFIGEGTANYSDVVPLKLLERAKRRGAASVIIAHNHPLGDALASVADITSTLVIKEMFSQSGIRLSAHYVISGERISKIDPDNL